MSLVYLSMNTMAPILTQCDITKRGRGNEGYFFTAPPICTLIHMKINISSAATSNDISPILHHRPKLKHVDSEVVENRSFFKVLPLYCPSPSQIHHYPCIITLFYLYSKGENTLEKLASLMLIFKNAGLGTLIY